MAARKKLTTGLLLLAIMATVVGARGIPAEEHDTGPLTPLTRDQIVKARNLFNNWNCGGCHILTDAEAYGDGGASFDGNKHLDRDFILDRIGNGINGMDSYRGLINDDDIELLASYILQVKK